MKIVVINENREFEQRVALTPEVSKKLIEMGHEIAIEAGAGVSAGFTDEAYKAAGAKIAKTAKDAIKSADMVIRISAPEKEDIANLPAGSILIGNLKPYTNQDRLKDYTKNKVTAIAMELVPRISRAQAMDVLSSQSNLAGYKAVVDAAAEYGRAMPMMMTAAGMIPPARVLILGAGVAGLQAIATAKRLGAIVSAFDVRPAVKEQVQSLGATFVEVESEESGEGTGGYAKEMSDDYKRRQSERLAEVMKDQDIVITTAQIPGKAAPELITTAMVESMKAGSIIVDLAVESGGNCKLSELGKTVVKHDVKIIGHPNFPSRIPSDASQVYARNVLNYIKNMYKDNAINWDDEIVSGSALTRDGTVVHPQFKTKE
jgi:H+-translocating NAD(P) transhydrogenase subunit alpha